LRFRRFDPSIRDYLHDPVKIEFRRDCSACRIHDLQMSFNAFSRGDVDHSSNEAYCPPIFKVRASFCSDPTFGTISQPDRAILDFEV
jgi:hypothetical protein